MSRHRSWRGRRTLARTGSRSTSGVFPLVIPILILCAAHLPRAASAGCLDYSRYMRWAGSYRSGASDVAIAGSHGYITASDFSNSHLEVLDVSNPQLPRHIASTAIPNATEHDVAISPWGDYAYVVGDFSLGVVDIQYPAYPSLVATLDLPNPAADIAVSYEFLIVATYSEILVYDIYWSPAEPQLLGSVDLGGAIEEIALLGGFLCAAQGAALKVVGIGDGTHPTIVATMPLPGAGRVVVQGNCAYASSSTGVVAVDVSNPAAPHIVGGLPYSGVSAVAADGARLFVATASGLAAADVADPLHPHALGRIGPSSIVDNMVLSGSYAYIAYGQSRLLIVNVAQGEAAAPAASVGVQASGTIAIRDSIACVAHGSRLIVLDVHEPLAPHVLGSTPLKMAASNVEIGSSHAYVSEYVGPNRGQLEVVDLSAPAAPVVVGTLVLPGEGNGVALASSFAYVTCGSSLLAINVRDPLHPNIAGSATTAGQANAVCIPDSSHYAYVAVSGYGLEIFDLSNPSWPDLCGHYQDIGGGSDLAVSGDHAYLVHMLFGLHVIDVSDPTFPVGRGYLYTGLVGYFGRVAASEGTVAVQANGIQLLDVADPVHPQFAGTAFGPGGSGITISGGFIFEGATDAFRVWCTQAEPVAVEDPDASATAQPELNVEIVPNPVMYGTDIRFILPAPGIVRVVVYDTSGRRVRRLQDGPLGSGDQRLFWDGRDEAGHPVAQGVYMAKVIRGRQAASQRVVVVR